MHITFKYLAAMAASTLLAASACAQNARDVRGASPLVAIENEAPAKLIVDPPLPEPLSRGMVFIQYRTMHARTSKAHKQFAGDMTTRSLLATARVSYGTLLAGCKSTTINWSGDCRVGFELVDWVHRSSQAKKTALRMPVRPSSRRNLTN